MMSRFLSLSLYLYFALVCAGCTGPSAKSPRQPSAPPKPAVKLAPATPLEQKKEELGGNTWEPQWDIFIERALPADMFSTRAARAVRGYCPRFAEESTVNKRAFWAYFFQALAGAEAGLDPTTNVHHTEPAVALIDKATKRPIRQEGLLQLTYEDGRRYGCAFDWRRDRTLPGGDPARSILQPEKNLSCGIRILQNQIIRQKKPLIVLSSYWSTLRPGTVSYRVFEKQMANVPAACGVGVLKPRHTTHRRASVETAAGGLK